jgi:copper oxidase (laccase) domain-containing protein
VIGLAHAGKEGTRLGVVPAAIETMRAQFGSRAPDLVVQLSPCIRPPDFEVDFAAEICRQCERCGVESIHDDGTSTAGDLTRFYSYRMEKGRTGRMLALLGLPRNCPA